MRPGPCATYSQKKADTQYIEIFKKPTDDLCNQPWRFQISNEG